MELIIILTIIFLLLGAGLSRHLLRNSQWINPIAIFNVPHALLLLCYLIGLERNVFTFALTGTHVALLITGYLCFNIAVIFTAFANTKKAPIPPSWSRQLEVASTLARLLLPILVVSVAYKYSLLLRTYGNILANIIAIRLDYVSGELNYSWANTVAFTASHFLVLVLGVLEGSQARYRWRRPVLVLSVITIIANDISIGGANWTFSALCLFICSWLVTYERLFGLQLPWRKKQKLLAGAAIAVSVIFTLLYVRSTGSIGGEVSFFDIILYYAGGDIATFGYFVDHPYQSIPPGRFTLGGLYELANGFTSLFGTTFLTPLDDKDFIADIGQNSNTSIHLAHYYCDFGVYGVIGYSLLLGTLTMFAMQKVFERCHVVRLQYFALTLYICVMSIRGVPTEGKYFWTLLVTLPIAYIAVDSYVRFRSKRSDTLHTNMPLDKP